MYAIPTEKKSPLHLHSTKELLLMQSKGKKLTYEEKKQVKSYEQRIRNERKSKKK